MKDYNHRRSSDRIWAQEERLFRQKMSFSRVFSVTKNFFSLVVLISFINPLHQKNSKSLMLEVAKVLKLTLFSVRSLKSLTSAFSQIFLVTSIFFFKILTTGAKGGIIPKSERNPDVRD